MESFRVLIFIIILTLAAGCRHTRYERDGEQGGSGELSYARIKGTVTWESATYTATESGGRLTVTALIETRAHSGTVVPLTFEGTAGPADYTPSTTWLRFEKGEKRASIDI